MVVLWESGMGWFGGYYTGFVGLTCIDKNPPITGGIRSNKFETNLKMIGYMS